MSIYMYNNDYILRNRGVYYGDKTWDGEGTGRYFLIITRGNNRDVIQSSFGHQQNISKIWYTLDKCLWARKEKTYRLKNGFIETIKVLDIIDGQIVKYMIVDRTKADSLELPINGLSEKDENKFVSIPENVDAYFPI